MRSSYAANQYEEVFFALVQGFRPLLAVELGVLDGYSTRAIARGLRANTQRDGSQGRLEAYDLFEDYPYRHGTQEAVQAALEADGLQPWVSVAHADAWTVHERYDRQSVGFLHVDISNTGETIHRILELWDSKLPVGGVIAFEGGSSERDEVEWMRTYQAPSIQQAIETNPLLNSRYVYGTYLRFPSMTTCLKKR